MSQLEEHECYCCGTYGPHMNIIAGTEEGNLWWCQDPAWCRARAIANKLHNDSARLDRTFSPHPFEITTESEK